MSIATREPGTLPLVFDYADLDSETRIVVQQKTGEIKERLRRTASDIIEVGDRLTDIKARLGHGKFGVWLRAEFTWSERTAQNFMLVSEAFKSANFAEISIAPSALSALAAPSVPEAARQEVIEVAANGHHVTHKEAQEVIAKHKPEPTPKPQPVYEKLFEEDDRKAEAALTATEPLPESPETEDSDNESMELSPPPVSQGEKNAEAWGEIVSKYLFLVNSVRRRGGMATLAEKWPKVKVRDARQVCAEIVETFTTYRDELKGLL